MPSVIKRKASTWIPARFGMPRWVLDVLAAVETARMSRRIHSVAALAVILAVLTTVMPAIAAPPGAGLAPPTSTGPPPVSATALQVAQQVPAGGGPSVGAALPGPAGLASKTVGSLAELALQAGIERLKDGDALGAIDRLLFSLEGNPGSSVALTALGDAYVRTDDQGLAALAIEAYKGAIVLDPASIHAREGAARTAWLLGHQDEAIEQMEALYWAEGQVRDGYASELASYYMLSQQLDRGLQLFARTLPKSGERHATMLLMAAMLMEKQDKKTARLFVERVLAEAPPDSPMAQQARRMLTEGVAER